ncbi:MAG: hypothetical protein ACRD0I_12140, partial [Acidimicrobiales bacterium]
MTSPQPQSQVGITGAWFDPLDPRTWSGMFARVIEEFENMGVYAGFRDAGPLAGASRALYHWMGLTGRAGGSWMLEPEMRAAAWLSIPAIRRRRPRNAGAWIVPAGTVGR